VAQPPLEREFLVVDDNEDAARLLVDVLTEKGYQTVALDAPAALEAAMELRREIAILDIGLPVMDGYDLATALRELPGLANWN
jgi:CheY-like chemotaxis protein